VGSVDDDVCPNAKRRLPRILPVAFFFSALLATCAAILSLSFMPVACGVLLDHTYRAWPPQALQKFRQLIFRWPARARRESIPASAEVHSTSGTRRAFTVGLSQSGFHSRAFTVGLSQSGFHSRALGGREQRKTSGVVVGTDWSLWLPLTPSRVHRVMDSVAEDIVAPLR